uniref:Mitochondrial protein n=1 Tax=Cajanus cajan TaxID=3821 RepID=A0A151T2T2_CAJCA|nr:hypothetical protein KK1_015824 [Cajanus cajan]
MEVNVKLQCYDGELLQDPTLYRQLVGSLIYLTITRANISFVVHSVSKFMQTPQHLHLSVAQHIISYLPGTSSHGLFFPTDASPQLQAYNDSVRIACLESFFLFKYLLYFSDWSFLLM